MESSRGNHGYPSEDGDSRLQSHTYMSSKQKTVRDVHKLVNMARGNNFMHNGVPSPEFSPQLDLQMKFCKITLIVRFRKSRAITMAVVFKLNSSFFCYII
jgi:hypothetical protein